MPDSRTILEKGTGIGTRGSLLRRSIYLLPYVVALSYVSLFALADNYDYNPNALNDQGLFQRVAANIADNGEFSGSPGSAKVFCPTRPPLYPFLIALSWKATHSRSLVYIRSVQVIFYLLSIFLIFRISLILTEGDAKYAFLSSFSASLIPHTAALTHVILAESLAIFLLVLAVWLMVRQKDESRSYHLVLLGLTLGLLTLQRPNFLYIPFFFAGYLICSLAHKTPRKIFACCALIALPFAITMLPWLMYKQTKDVQSYSPAYGIGFNLMAGILEASPSQMNAFLPALDEKNTDWNIDRRPYYAEMEEVFHSRHQLLSPDTGYFTPGITKLVELSLRSFCEAWYLDPASPEIVMRSDRFLAKAALIWIRAHPLKFLAVIMHNAKNLVFGNYLPLIYHQLSGDLPRLAAISRLLLYLSFAAGVFFSLWYRRFRPAFVPLMIVSYLVAVHALMHADPRYFVYAYMLMAVPIPSVIMRGSGSLTPGRRKNAI